MNLLDKIFELKYILILYCIFFSKINNFMMNDIYKIKYFNEKERQQFNANFEYDVLRVTTNKSIFDEPTNYLNRS